MTHDTPASAARYAHEYILDTPLVGNILEHAGEYDAKTDPEETTSLAAHVINAMTIGVNTFVYNAVDGGRDIMELEEDLSVLAAALALHDTNKYVREAYGVEAEGNTGEAFDAYFENGDDFGVEAFLGDGYRDDLHYLVQRTEVNEDSTETRGTETAFAVLERYCRIGDQVASVILRDGIERGFVELRKKLDDDEVHLIELTQVEQPILNDELLGATKEVISGQDDGEEYGVVVGSTPNCVLYLGDEVDRDVLRERVGSHLSQQLVETDRYSFSCKLNWNSFDYDILSEFSLDPEKKKEIIATTFRDLLADGTAGVEGFEHIPDDFDPYFPILAKAVYIDGQSEFDDEDVQAVYDDIYEEQGPQKVKIHFVACLLRNFEEHREFLEKLREGVRPRLHNDLEAESDAIGSVVDRFFDATMSPSLGSKEEMCFLCGAEAETDYQKGLSAVYRTQEFSRRVRPHAKYKKICEVCNLEYALLADTCERADVNLNANVGIAYYYFDKFLGDMRLRGGRVGFQQGETIDLGDTEVEKSLVRPQYYVQPFNFGGHPAMGEKNHRMVVVRQLMQAARDAGMKVVLGRPFTRFESTDAAFVDEDAIRQQELLGLDTAERFGPLPSFVDRGDGHKQSNLRRALSLCKIIAIVGQKAGMRNPYLQLDQDTFHHLADFAVRNHENATRLSNLESYLETYHTDQLMDMKTVAERGVDLFGEQYDSKYKKTKIFREAIDAFLSGKNQRMSDDGLRDHVAAQVYDAADREDYAGYVTTEEAEAFVDALEAYLVENELDTLEKLSDWENALVNSYLYAYEQTLYEDDNDDESSAN
ncbi:hypothetical protein [Natrinema salaciae]|uniref:CRISPR-associated protein Csc3 n=1 Tax=Natrinema salaciae TaxID=1186196 RepID=A0A1H9EWS3_9EURY|nr:hypothetical protein [Natrinema salaciae]SEQ30216.1 CRISPR-associated protein Csc3 [Natrinema salaciae]